MPERLCRSRSLSVWTSAKSKKHVLYKSGSSEIIKVGSWAEIMWSLSLNSHPHKRFGPETFGKSSQVSLTPLDSRCPPMSIHWWSNNGGESRIRPMPDKPVKSHSKAGKRQCLQPSTSFLLSTSKFDTTMLSVDEHTVLKSFITSGSWETLCNMHNYSFLIGTGLCKTASGRLLIAWSYWKVDS